MGFFGNIKRLQPALHFRRDETLHRASKFQRVDGETFWLPVLIPQPTHPAVMLQVPCLDIAKKLAKPVIADNLTHPVDLLRTHTKHNEIAGL